MTAINLTLPMINCSSCNRVIAHLIPEYKAMLPKLMNLISEGHDFSTDLIDVFTTFSGKDIYKSYLQIYFINADEEDRKLFDPRIILIYALLDNTDLSPSDFPFRSIVKRYKWCCSRMFLCDPTRYA